MKKGQCLLQQKQKLRLQKNQKNKNVLNNHTNALYYFLASGRFFDYRIF